MRRTKIVAAMLSLVFVFMLFPSLRVSAASTGECGTDLTYTLDDAGNLTISGTGNKIDPGPFSYNTSIKTVTMPDSVTSIDIGAFRECTSLETIEMPGVTLLEHHAFYGCTSLKTIEMPKATSIGEFAFWGCISLETIEMPEVTSIGGQRTFYGCTNLKTIEMPKATSIGEWAFAGCTSLETIEMPEVTSIGGQRTFSGCTSLETIEMPKVTSIGERAFENCTSLKTIEMPEVTSIGERAFSGCTSLKTIEMPEVTSIGDYAFRECTSLETIEMPEVTSIGDYAFLDCTSLETIEMPEVTSIGDYAFLDCTGLKTIEMPEVTSIGEGAFYGCTSLSSVTIPDSVIQIEKYAFYNCSSLTDVTMSKDLYDKLVQNNKLGDVFYGITLPSIHVRYTVDYKSNGNGTISGTTTKSFGTDQIELTIQPDSNYVLDKIEWSDGTNTVKLTATNGKYTMPDSEAGVVTITASFKLDQKTVTFNNEDGTVLQSGAVDYGTNPTYTGTTPTKAEDDQYTYAFAGWSDGSKTYGPTDTLPAVTDDATYTAVFDSTVRKFTIKFINEDGTILKSGDFDYGTTPAYTGSTPTKAEDDDYTYTFAGWTPAIASVTGNATYTATFTETAKPTPEPTTPAPVTVSKPGTYYLSSMVEQDGNIVITIKMSEDDTKTFDLLGSVTSDGVPLTEGNQYTAAKGSAIITINKSFLDTLAAGNHKLTVTFTDGGSITIDYEVKAPAAAPQVAAQAAVQATGEATAITAFVGIGLILTACGITVITVRKRKEEA